jgi:D-glycero-beta-D-manno-heptose 1-phosphate adenylyltransferase
MDKFEHLKSKILTKEELRPLLNVLKFKGKKIVFSNGCFDILHRGHVEYLSKAASLGDCMVIGLNTDASVKRLKGENRPVQDQISRSQVMASLHFVNYVVFFDEDTPFELISYLKPDILVKGSDYKEDDIVGADVVKANGGKVVTVDLVDGYSTTSIIERSKK